MPTLNWKVDSVLLCILLAAVYAGSQEAEGRRVAIIGASGYVGSRLYDYLVAQGLDVVGFDRDPRDASRNVTKMASYDMPEQLIAGFDAFIYLGGLTGRVACDSQPKLVTKENVDDVVSFATKLNSRQLFVYASTSAVAEGTGQVPAKEAIGIQFDLLDRYAKSMAEREIALQKASGAKSPTMVGLRFGTVIGLSPSQRLEFLHIAMTCQAHLTGRISVRNPDSYRAMLYLEDLVRAVHALLSKPPAAEFNIYHLSSFGTSVGSAALEIARQTGAHVDVQPSTASASAGFTLDSTKFREAYNFSFYGSSHAVVKRLVENVPLLCMGREITWRRANTSIPCVVCGSHDMQSVLDLGEQALANDFSASPEVALKRERYPLHLVRCRKCHHAQLSYLVDRSRLFSNYSYQSGTSSTLAKYFEWVADKVINDAGKPVGTVLEIACNDGSQLDKFRARGWKTYGVDPAKNIVPLARAKGHIVFNGFWGAEKFDGLPPASEIDAIVAQNVLAHTGTPVQFVKDCAASMGLNTRLYLQTSQCEMFLSGQFDTCYHEHVSFFSAHSFRCLADQAGLSITNFEITEIHGRSCFVTMMKKQSASHGPAVRAFQDREVAVGILNDYFYLKFRAQANNLRSWIHDQLNNFHAQGYTIAAYGAAAKGMVLLQYMRELPGRQYEFAYVMDDAPLKQNTFCAGTTIPVKPTSAVKDHPPTKPLVIVVFAWNFADELLRRLAAALQGTQITKVLAVLPFPTQRVLHLTTGAPVFQNIFKPKPWPRATTVTTVGVMHFYNEELLLPYWVYHHSSLFDHVVVIDHHSTDQSASILRRILPSNWRYVVSNISSAQDLEQEIMLYESQYPGAWKIALTANEFLVARDLREMLTSLEAGTRSVRFPALVMIGNDSVPLEPYRSLPAQRSLFTGDASNPNSHIGEHQYTRLMHNAPNARYSAGRHQMTGAEPSVWAPSGFLEKFQWTPWPELLPRKLQIRGRQQGSKESLAQEHDEIVMGPHADFSQVPVSRNRARIVEKAFDEWFAVCASNLTVAW